MPDPDAAWDELRGGDVAVVLLKSDSELLTRISKEPAFASIPVILFGSPLVVSPEALSDRLVLLLPERVDSRDLLAIGCDYGQGFGYAPALSAQEAEVYLNESYVDGAAPVKARGSRG